MMLRIRCTVLVALTVALCATPAAAVGSSHQHGKDAAVVPVHQVAGTPVGQFLGEGFVRDYETAADDPRDPCDFVGNRDKALVMGPTDVTTSCTVSRRTQLIIFGLGAACSNVEPEPFYGKDEAAQRACAIGYDQTFITALRVTIDGQAPVDIRTERFEVVSPQVTADVPPNQAFGLPAGPATLVAHAWLAQIRKLPAGQHTVVIEGVGTDFTVTSTYILTVLNGGSGDNVK